MRPQKVDTEVMMQGLMRVLRNRGYDGASLKELAEATGLKKASLYHRFPGGKQEMAEAVLSHMHEWSSQHVHNLLQDRTYPAAERLEQVLQNVNQLYAGGDISCIFRALSTEFGLDLFGEQLEHIQCNKTTTKQVHSIQACTMLIQIYNLIIGETKLRMRICPNEYTFHDRIGFSAS